MVLQTDFKLSIFYMRSGAVQVMSPVITQTESVACVAILTTRTEDDFKIPDRSLVQNTHILGQSVCDEPTLPRVCTDAEEQKYGQRGLLWHANIQTRAVLNLLICLNAHSFFRSCMFDIVQLTEIPLPLRCH